MGIENLIKDALHKPNDYVAYHVGRELAELYPGKAILAGATGYFDLEAFVPHPSRQAPTQVIAPGRKGFECMASASFEKKLRRGQDSNLHDLSVGGFQDR